MKILHHLLAMENILHKCETMPPYKNRLLSDDKERYLKMAIRIDPHDLMVLYRKKEYKSIANVMNFDTKSSTTSRSAIRILT